MKQIRPKKYHLCTGFLLILFGCFMGYHIAELHERRHFEYRELSDFLASHGSGAVFNMEQCNTSAIRASAGLLAVPSTNRSIASAQYTFNKSDSVENFVLNRTTPVVETSQLISSDQIQHVYSSGELLKCKHLWKKDGKSNWFDENFNSSLKPIWSTDNIDLSTEAFSWWNKLQKEEPYPDVLALVKKLAVSNDPFLNDKPKGCIRCAVVGNSGNLKQSGYGKIIDSHNLVIRMNQCPVNGFEKDVGSKTTHYIAYPQSFRQEDLRNASLVLAAFSAQDMRWLRDGLAGKKDKNIKPVKVDRKKVFLFNPELMWHIKHQWGIGEGKWPSTGIISAFFALQICDEVNIFGFGANRMGYWDHYFENNDGKANSEFQKTHVHDSDAESQLLKKFSDDGKIVFYRGART